MGYQLDKRQFEILDMLVKFNTESPPGRNTDPLQDEIETLLKQLDFSIQREQLYDNDSVIVATLKGHNPQAPKLILNGHVDVASVDDVDIGGIHLLNLPTKMNGYTVVALAI